MSHFYLTRPINSPLKYYQDNTLTHFTTKLLGSISLSVELEVGLTKIVFPHTWLTIEKSEAWFTLTSSRYTVTYPEVGNMPAYTMEVRFPYRYYESVHDLIREINKSLAKLAMYAGVVSITPREDNQMPNLKYNETSKRIHFLMDKNQSLTFQPALAIILGVGAKQSPSKPKDENMFTWISSTSAI